MTTPLLIGLGMAIFVLIIAVLMAGGLDSFRSDAKLRATDEVHSD